MTNGDYGETSRRDLNPSFRLRWDVFLSFRGEDTRSTFIELLYTELDRNGVRTFRDNEGLKRGEVISSALLEAIQNSTVAIVVISERYGDSRWCLEELSMIVKCVELVFPVFYGVDPSDVRKQKGPFEKDFEDHEKRVKLDSSLFCSKDVLRWRKAMATVGGIAGWDSSIWKGKELVLVNALVKEVLKKVNNTPLGVAKHPVGIDSRLQKVMDMMDVKLNGVRVLGLYGMGGIGKTTLAKAIYNKLVGDFKRSSFISDVRETWEKENGSKSLQRKLIGDLSLRAVTPVVDISEGIISMKKLIDLEEPVLIVLDDVDNLEQLDALASSRDWFYEGSRIIITTRYKPVLWERIVSQSYEVEELKSDESLQLFSYHAFGRDTPIGDFMDISKQVVLLAGGLPLALEVFGSFLYDKRNIKDWNDAHHKLKQIRPGNLHDVLKISYDALDEQEQCIFLDIACFFVHNNVKREDAIDIFRGCGFNAEIMVTVLTLRSLLRIDDDGNLSMHDQIRDMGRQIVQGENYDPGMRSRLWKREEVMTALTEKKGTRGIQGLVLNFEKKRDLSSEEICWIKFKASPGWSTLVMYLKEVYQTWTCPRPEEGAHVELSTEAFESMVNLRLLQINRVKLAGRFSSLPSQLKWLQWKGCHLKYLPRDLCLQHIAILDLSESNLAQLWGWLWWPWSKNKMAENLLVLDLHDCYYLTSLPDLSKQKKLEKLILEKCVGLNKVHRSVGDLHNLIHLNMKGCSNLVDFPSDVSGLKNVKELILSGCVMLTKLPEEIGYMKSLKELLVDQTSIVKVPDSIFNLNALEKFSLSGCRLLKHIPSCIWKLSSLRELKLDGSNIEQLPESIGSLPKLEILNLSGCKSLTAVPESIGNLESLVELFLHGSSIKEIPGSIGKLVHLKTLSVSRCQSLGRLPESIEGLLSLTEFWLEWTLLEDVPVQIGNLKMLRKLTLGNCKSLRSLPDSIGKLLNLTELSINDTAITELPGSFGELEKLNNLKLHNCKQLKKLPNSFGNLKSLRYLYMADSALSELPENFGMLSSLQILKMSKSPDSVENTNLVTLPMSFSNLSKLLEFDARNWKISGNIHDGFENMSSLESLDLSRNCISSLPSSLKGLSHLKSLSLSKNKELKVLPQLPSSLVKLNVADCTALESMYDLSELEHLQELNLTNCSKIIDIPGLEHLKSLRRLYTGGCNSCFPALKKRLAKVALKHLQNLSVPSSDIPKWFVQEIPRFTVRKNHKIKAVLIAVVVSLDHTKKDDFKDKLPAIVDIQAKIIRFNDPIFTTTLYLLGVPNSNEDQLYLCRFKEYSPLLLLLKDGDKLHLALRDKPCFNGLELKKYGFHLVYEDEDDIDDEDEEWLDESRWSVSFKLAKFFDSL